MTAKLPSAVVPEGPYNLGLPAKAKWLLDLLARTSRIIIGKRRLSGAVSVDLGPRPYDRPAEDPNLDAGRSVLRSSRGDDHDQALVRADHRPPAESR